MSAPFRACLLFLLGIPLLLVVLFWNRISLGGPNGQAPDWVQTLSFPIDVAVTRTLGPIDPPGEAQSARVLQLVASWSVAVAFYFGALAFALSRCRGNPLALDAILAWSVVLRVVAIASPPLLETDPRRYLWDGAVTAAGLDPYRHSPLEVLLYREGRIDAPSRTAEFELERLGTLSLDRRLDPQFRGINHPAVPSCYPPAAQLVFSAAARLAPGDVYALKAMMALFDLGALGMLLALLRLTGRPEVWALAYGWCPLALKEYAQTGHFDPVATFFLLASLYTLARGRRALAGILAGFGIGAKLFPAVFVAVAWRRFGARGIALAAAALALLAWPYAGDGIRAFAGIGTYGMQWVGNASVFALVAWLFSPLGRLGLSTAMAAKVVLGALGAAGLFAVSRRPEATPAQLADKALVAVGMLFVLSPVQNPWYAGWLLPLAALSGRISWLVLSGTMVTYYAWFSASSYWRVVPGLGLPVDLRWLEYAPFFALLWLESRSYSEEESSRMDAPRPV